MAQGAEGGTQAELSSEKALVVLDPPLSPIPAKLHKMLSTPREKNSRSSASSPPVSPDQVMPSLRFRVQSVIAAMRMRARPKRKASAAEYAPSDTPPLPSKQLSQTKAVGPLGAPPPRARKGAKEYLMARATDGVSNSSATYAGAAAKYPSKKKFGPDEPRLHFWTGLTRNQLSRVEVRNGNSTKGDVVHKAHRR